MFSATRRANHSASSRVGYPAVEPLRSRYDRGGFTQEPCDLEPLLRSATYGRICAAALIDRERSKHRSNPARFQEFSGRATRCHQRLRLLRRGLFARQRAQPVERLLRAARCSPPGRKRSWPPSAGRWLRSWTTQRRTGPERGPGRRHRPQCCDAGDRLASPRRQGAPPARRPPGATAFRRWCV